MWQLFNETFSTAGLIPHGYCLQWNAPLLWTFVASDSIIAGSYFSIPFAIWYFAKKRPDYYRLDMKISFRKNKGKTTRVLELDIQNVTNNLNVAGDYWDDNKQKVVEYSQLGLLPNINYRIEF